MTREEAIRALERADGYVGIHYINGVEEAYINPHLREAVKVALSALRLVSREQVEKVWRGKWIDAHPGTSSCKCTKCGAVQEYESTFCCHCGAPMTDEAVEMVVKRMEVLNDAD